MTERNLVADVYSGQNLTIGAAPQVRPQGLAWAALIQVSERLSRAAASRVDAGRATLDRTGHLEGRAMRVLCAWCLKENKPEAEALIGEREPLADKRESHGICEHHRRELEERAIRLREDIRRQAERQQADVEDLRKKVDP